jgi:hypothetical protein
MRLDAVKPIQYQAPLFRALAERVDLRDYFAHRADRRELDGGRLRRQAFMGQLPL